VDRDLDGREAPDAASRDGLPEGLGASLDLELAPFAGPLTAFVLGGEDGPILLGGDLHAIHPETADPRPPGEPDHSLDSATLIIDDLEQPPVETAAVDGIWCLALPDGLLDSAPYLALWDTEGRLRAWLLLPQANRMIGIGHLWLPQVKPPPDSSDGTPTGPVAPTS
jgi:hypothetical protein